jgi:hypothetical protein
LTCLPGRFLPSEWALDLSPRASYNPFRFSEGDRTRERMKVFGFKEGSADG